MSDSTSSESVEYFIGLMSGTSVDGVDAALVKASGDQLKLVEFVNQPITDTLKQQLTQLNQNPNIHLEYLCLLQKQVAELFSQAVSKLLKQSNLCAVDITAIGSHGQTIYHAPDIGMTLQIGHPAIIAKNTGITTVADFRVDDMALGGQGAPFAPAFHEQLFAKPCVVVNIGGIANLSYLPSAENQSVLGYDTGPGNALLDEVCQQQFQQPYDKNGELARQGTVNSQLLSSMLQHPYFSQTAPKSTGRETFHLAWLEELISKLAQSINKHDLLATLTELTASTIANEIKNTVKSNEDVWIVGGGAFNDFLIERLQSLLIEHKVQSSSAIQVNPDAVEACLCAWLAQQRLANETVNLAATTGASRNAVLGGVWHP